MVVQKIVAATAVAGLLGAAALGLGAATAKADPGWGPGWGPNIPGIPGPGDWVPDVDLWPGPGEVAKWCPWHSPPGHWIGGPHGIPCT